MLVNDKIAAIDRSLDRGHTSKHVAARAPDLAPDEIVPVKRARRQRLQFGLPQPQLGPGERLRVVHRADAGKSHDRTPLMKPDVLNLVLPWPAGGANEHSLPDPETFFHEVRFRIHDDVPPEAMRARHTADEQ